MAIHIFGSATHDFYISGVSLPPALQPLLNTDGQGIVYLSMSQQKFFEAVRRAEPLPELEKLSLTFASFLPLAHARPQANFSTGKAANPAAICGMFGLRPTFYCALGEDDYSQRCIRELTDLGVTVKADIIPGKTMAHAHIFIESTQRQLSLIHKGTNNLARHELVPDAALHAHTTLLINTSVPLEETRLLLERAYCRGVPRIVFNCTKAAGLTEKDFTAVTDIVINRDEAKALASHFKFSFDDENDQTIATVLAEELGVRCVMTRGGESVLVAHHGKLDEVFPNPVNVKDVTGSGDGFLGAYLAGLDQGKDIVQTVKEAVVVGGLIAEHVGPRRCDLTQSSVTAQAAAIRVVPSKTDYAHRYPARQDLRA